MHVWPIVGTILAYCGHPNNCGYIAECSAEHVPATYRIPIIHTWVHIMGIVSTLSGADGYMYVYIL